MGQALPGSRKQAFEKGAGGTSGNAAGVALHEPDMDMDRRAVGRAADHTGKSWYRRFAAVFPLARPNGILARPRRQIDRERQEFPFYGD